jgi:hypothetical protein
MMMMMDDDDTGFDRVSMYRESGKDKGKDKGL